VRVDFGWRRPPQVAARLRSRRSFDTAGTEQLNDEVKPTGRLAPHLIRRRSSQLLRAISGLLKQLASRGILESFVALHDSAREEPFTNERPGALLDQENASGVIDARNDRADPRGTFGHVR